MRKRTPTRLPELTHVEPVAVAVREGDVEVLHRSDRPPAALDGVRRGTAEIRPAKAQARFQALAVGRAVTDAASIVGALLLNRFWPSNPPLAQLHWIVICFVFPVLWMVVFESFGLYNVRFLSAQDEFRRILAATGVGGLVVLLAGWEVTSSLSRLVIGMTIFSCVFLELSTREAWRLYQQRLMARGGLSSRTLIVGTNEDAIRLAALLRERGSGFIPVGFLSTTEATGSADSLPVLGTLAELVSVIRNFGVECLFVASSALGAEDMARVAALGQDAEIELRVATNLPPVLPSRLGLDQMGPLTILSLRPNRHTLLQAGLKRAFDLALVALILPLALPLMAAIAVAVRVTSPGPVLFRQQRVTQGGRPFTLYKFRTMVHDAELSPEFSSIDPTTPYFKLRDDPRLTPVGRFLRTYSLDELPQLWNILRGDMSLVGPRPLWLKQVVSDLDLLAARHRVKAGLTGWWQINGRSDLSPEESVQLDLFYVQNRSLLMDLYILWKTVGVVLSRRGAY